MQACAVLLLVFAVACERHAPPPDAPPDPAPKAAPAATALPRPVTPAASAWFGDHAPLPIAIELDDEARASLKRQPRKFTRATVHVAGQTLKEVGIRLKGHRTLYELEDRPSLILSFDRFAPKRTLFGQRRVVLNGMVDDPTLLREALGYAVFRGAGVAAPRTGYADLTLDGKAAGLLLVVEAVDLPLLRHSYNDATGNLFEGEYGCDVYTSDVWGFDHDSGSDTSRSHLKALAAKVEDGSSSLFAGDNPPLAVERVLAFLAVSAVIGDFDGYQHAHNYYLYHEPDVDRWSLIPWGIDRVLFKNLGLTESGGRLAERCFSDPPCRLAYFRTVRDVINRVEAADLPAQATAIAARIDAVARSTEDGRKRRSRLERKRRSLFKFLRGRVARVRAELACLDGDKEVDPDGDGHGCMDCAPRDPTVYPGAVEVCDGKDNDCSGWIDDTPACPCPSAEIDGATFFFCKQEMNWWRAAKHCESMGHHLARIDNKVQSDAVYEATQKINDERWWIGLSDHKREGHFAWHDGAPLAFTHWKRHEPNNGYCGEDCAAFDGDDHGYWYDVHCGLRRPFVCRKADPAVNLAPKTTPTD